MALPVEQLLDRVGLGRVDDDQAAARHFARRPSTRSPLPGTRSTWSSGPSWTSPSARSATPTARTARTIRNRFLCRSSVCATLWPGRGPTPLAQPMQETAGGPHRMTRPASTDPGRRRTPHGAGRAGPNRAARRSVPARLHHPHPSRSSVRSARAPLTMIRRRGCTATRHRSQEMHPGHPACCGRSTAAGAAVRIRVRRRSPS